MKPKIAIVSSRFPFPLIKGDKLRLFYQIKTIAQNFSICLIAITDVAIADSERNKLKCYCEEVHILPLAKWRRYAKISFSLRGQLPIQVAYFYSPGLKKIIHKIIDSYQADLAYFQLIRTALYAQGLKIPCVLDYMDAFSTIAQRDSNFSTGIRKAIFNMEAKRLVAFERKVFEWFKETIVISEQDREELGNPLVSIVTNGVDLQKFRPIDRKVFYDVCFVGNLGYAPNQRAIKVLTSKVMPRLLYKRPQLKFLLAGARPPKKILDLASENIDVLPNVIDIRDAYAMSKVFVAPIFTGAGQQNKILESMAMGVPCVTSTIVNSSIGANPDQIRIGFSTMDFVNHTIDLLDNAELYKKQRLAALDFVREHYSWEVQGDKLNEILESVISRKIE